MLTASLARQALEIFMQWQPDVIVSDTALPNNDNYVLIQQVRTNAGERGKVVIGIALTDYDHQDICDGFDMQFTKPLDINEFVAEVACLTIS